MSQDLTLRSGAYEMGLAPSVGGAVSRLTWHGVHLLRPAPAILTDALQSAMFVLAPFANRIAHGRFEFDGRPVQLPRNYGDHPHALHGHAWQTAWRVQAHEESSAVLTFVYPGGDWPWSYECRHCVSLSASGATFALTVCNTSAAVMPMSFGFHPYFPKARASIFATMTRGVWEIDDTTLPTTLTEPGIDLSRLAMETAPLLDHCFTGWPGVARFEADDMIMILSGDRVFPFLHLYVPTSDFFCVEPVSAMPDAVNRHEVEDNGLIQLAPGESCTGAMRLSVSAAR